MTDLELAPRLLDELTQGTHRTAIVLEEEPITAGQRVRLCSTTDPIPVASAEIDATVSGTIEIVEQRIIDREFGIGSLPPLNRPGQLVERLPGDHEIDDPVLTELEPPYLRFLRLTNIQPIVTDGGDNPFDEDLDEALQDERFNEAARHVLEEDADPWRTANAFSIRTARLSLIKEIPDKFDTVEDLPTLDNKLIDEEERQAIDDDEFLTIEDVRQFRLTHPEKGVESP